MKIELITPESGPSRRLRKWRLIRFPQLTMPLLAAYTPPSVELHHTDEIVEPVDLDRDADLVVITCNTPAAAHAYRLAGQLRARGRRVVLGGPHVTAMPSDALRHADALVIGEGELVWPEIVNDFARGRWQEIYPRHRSLSQAFRSQVEAVLRDCLEPHEHCLASALCGDSHQLLVEGHAHRGLRRPPGDLRAYSTILSGDRHRQRNGRHRRADARHAVLRRDGP